MMTTGELLAEIKELKEACNSSGCGYGDWLDLQMRIERIDEELMQRSFDEMVTERYTEADEAYDNLMGSKEWTNIGPDYGEEW